MKVVLQTLKQEARRFVAGNPSLKAMMRVNSSYAAIWTGPARSAPDLPAEVGMLRQQ